MKTEGLGTPPESAVVEAGVLADRVREWMVLDVENGYDHAGGQALDSLLARLSAAEQERDALQEAFYANTRVGRVQVAEARAEALVNAIREERRWATGTAEHNDARTELYRLAALEGT